MSKRNQLILFVVVYLVFIGAFYWARHAGGWWWVLPWGLVVALIAVFFEAERHAHRDVALAGYRYGFWAIVLVLLALECARAVGAQLDFPPALWAVPPAVWLVYYGSRVWKRDEDTTRVHHPDELP